MVRETDHERMRKRWNTERISIRRSKSPPFISFSLSFSILLFLSLLKDKRLGSGSVGVR